MSCVVKVHDFGFDYPFGKKVPRFDEMVAVQRREHCHSYGHEKPEPRQAVALREKLRRVELLARREKAR